LAETARDVQRAGQTLGPEVDGHIDLEPARLRPESRSTHATHRPSARVEVGTGTPPVSKAVPPAFRQVALAMALSDIASFVAGTALAHGLPFGPRASSGLEMLLLLGTCFPLVGVVFSALHLYGRHLFAFAEEFRRLLLAVSVVIVGLVATPLWPEGTLSRLAIGVTWLSSFAFVLATRCLWHRYVRRELSRGRMISRTIIVGTNREAEMLGGLQLIREAGLLPIAFITTSSSNGKRPHEELPILGELGQLPQLIVDAAADCILVASSAVTVEDMQFLSKVARRSGTELRVSANLPEVHSSRLTVHTRDGVTILSVRPVRLSGYQAVAKRAFDIILSGLALLVLLPLLLVVAAAIKLTTPGHVLFRQPRVTKGDRVFTMYKFRTMRDSVVITLPDVDQSKAFFKLRKDPRVTGVGRMLRRLSLDELPQLLNVLRGDMSLVGPRPLPVEQVAAHPELLGPRHEVLAGLTGWWQIHGRSDLDPKESARLDQFYIENWSLGLDISIIIRTFGAVLSRRGAY
jgi:exopolysaccharide biosynthesis polyprenyl glycosylphosphotransferase